ncbi:MAG: hypothetical protein JO057_11390, partial [Chloroflexi bacterium]|nr:hypothetical protein [Chloroflexota bacterium]
MSFDFTKFPFPGVESPHAPSLTEGIQADPVDSGFIVATLKGGKSQGQVAAIGAFAQALRASDSGAGFLDVTAYRQLRTNEFGGAMPFDQAICDRILEDVESRR